MEDFNINNTSQNYSNITFDYEYHDFEYYRKVYFIMHVLTCIIISIGLPLTLVAIYALYSLVRNDHVAPIYVINLLISDVIQLCCLIIFEAQVDNWNIAQITSYMYSCGVAASVGFMMCVAMERYLLIVFPLWYRFRRTIKISVVVCVMVWAISAVLFVTYFISVVDINVSMTIFGIFLLLPFPLFIFFLVGTLKALSASRVPSDEKRRIVGTLVLVLLIYTLLFLPYIISVLTGESNITLSAVCFLLLSLSPLADLVLYVFMRKGTIDKLLASVCCCRMDSNDTADINIDITFTLNQRSCENTPTHTPL